MHKGFCLARISKSTGKVPVNILELRWKNVKRSVTE